MAMTVDLPAALEEDLREEAEREGVKPSEHAALLLSICTALLNDAEATPFSSAVKEFLSRRSLDSEHVAAALDALVRECLAAIHDAGKTLNAFHSHSGWSDGTLQAWRDSLVHQPWVAPAPRQEPVESTGRPFRGARGKYAHIAGTSEDFARQKEEEIAREERRRA